MTSEYWVEFDYLVEEHGKEKAKLLFEQFKETPPKNAIVDKDFGEYIAKKLPKGTAVLIDAKWGLENPDSEDYLEWCYQYHYWFPTLNSGGMLEVGNYHYYAHIESDEDGGETSKSQHDAIEYFKQMIQNMEIAA